MRRVLVLGLLLLLLGFVVALLLFTGGEKSLPPWFASVSNGNGYDTLVQAAAEMKGRPADEKAEPAAFVKLNDRMFELVRSALKVPFEVPLSMYSATNSMLPDFASFKSIALALRVKGRAAEERGMGTDAAAAYLDVIQLGQRVEHGPLIALLVGTAIERIGLDSVEKVARTLTDAQRKDLADRIDSLDRERLPFSEVVLRERYFARHNTGNPVKLFIGRFQVRPALKKAEQKQQQLSSDFQRVTKELRLPAKGG